MTTRKFPVKTILLSIGTILGAIIIMLTMSGCTDTCQTTTTYITYQPTFEPMADMRTQVAVLPPQSREGQGKIYVYGDYLLLGDPDLGIHVYDNSDQENPQAISFINIPGNRDMAIRNNRLYADSYIDLLVFDFSDPRSVSLTNRIENTFPQYNIAFGMAADTEMVVTGMQELETVDVSTNCTQNNPEIMWLEGDFIAFRADAMQTMNLANGPTIGTGGSMARFTIVGNTLYAVDDAMMHIFDLFTADDPEMKNSLSLGWGIETVFPYKNNLFIGSISGMSIYNIDNPHEPVYMSEVRHIRTCDPVVANDTHAFVTLRAENNNGMCGTTFTNQLDLIDITQIDNARLLKSFPMQSPHGLGLDDNLLFIAEGDGGLKIFDITEPNELDENQLHHLTGFNAFDVIPLNGTLILTGIDGLYQFDYRDIDEIKMLSLIPSASNQ
jgi:hypothetical protein